MLHKTQGIVLRSIKYGDSSLITTIFTARDGIQAYMVQGVRSAKAKQNRAGSFQPGMLLDLVVYHQPQRNMQRLREFQAAHIYNGLQEHVIKNSIVLFSVEVLLRLLPEHAPLPELFDFAYAYFVTLDSMLTQEVANFPLFFIIKCSRVLGYDLKGVYSSETPYLDIQEGGFTGQEPNAASTSYTSNEDAGILSRLLMTESYDALKEIEMNAAMRIRLIDWYIAFLQQHTQHMGDIRSLPILKAILHQ